MLETRQAICKNSRGLSAVMVSRNLVGFVPSVVFLGWRDFANDTFSLKSHALFIPRITVLSLRLQRLLMASSPWPGSRVHYQMRLPRCQLGPR